MKNRNGEEKQTPLFDALMHYTERQPVRYHIPGHKGGVFFHPAGRTYFETMLPLDVTEVTGLDDLHHPQEAILEAQRLAARTFFAEQTYFLVNGTTVGNLAMILSSLNKGDQVLVQRNAHKSVFNGLTLAEVEAIFLPPVHCPTFHVPVGVTKDLVVQALDHFPNAKALILTVPNYYGMTPTDVKESIRLAQENGLLVLIDEAHGAHFGQHPALPPSAMQLGADMSVQSTHKMLGSLTMSSMLHVQGNRVQRQDVETVLQALQSSSPSYPLMASLDLARDQLTQFSDVAWAEALCMYEELRHRIEEIGFYLVSPSIQSGKCWHDPFKLTIRPQVGSGYALQQELEQRGVVVELADPLNVLLTLPLSVQQEWNERFIHALADIAHAWSVQGKNKRENTPFLSAGLMQDNAFQPVQMRRFKASETEEVPFSSAIQRKAAEMILPYPPGVPLCVPNETISEHMLELIRQLQHFGAYFQGKAPCFDRLRVVKEHEQRSCRQPDPN